MPKLTVFYGPNEELVDQAAQRYFEDKSKSKASIAIQTLSKIRRGEAIEDPRESIDKLARIAKDMMIFLEYPESFSSDYHDRDLAIQIIQLAKDNDVTLVSKRYSILRWISLLGSSSPNGVAVEFHQIRADGSEVISERYPDDTGELDYLLQNWADLLNLSEKIEKR